MRSDKIGAIIFGLVIIFVITNTISTQGQELSKVELEKRAESYFKQQKFDRAAGDYRILHEMYPKETRYAYFLGRSYLEANQELETAIELLKYSAIRNYGNDSYFYLGRAFHLTYQFDEAILSFQTFQKTAKNRDLLKYDIEYWQKVAENAKASVLMAQKVTIEEIKEIKRNTPENGFTDQMQGKYIYIPDELKSKEDLEKDYQSLMYLSEHIQIGDYIYFDCLSNKSKQGSDVYRVRRLTAGDFSLPEPLSGVINSKYDERYPYFDQETSTLYFSSNGPNTIGGLDIFASKYDSSAGKWDTPQRLNFPINSVHDDFLYTVSPGGTKAVFISDRNNTLTDYTAYTMQIDREIKYELPINHDDMITLALLIPNAITINSESDIAENIPPAEKSIDPKQWEQMESVFDALIQEALVLQSQSDSLEWMASDLKIKADHAEDFQQKQALLASMTTLEQEARRLETLATEKFRQAEHLQASGYPGGVAENSVLNEGTELESGIVVYSYASDKKENKNKRSRAADNGMEAARLANQEIAVGFSIMQSSPYSESNPIPIVSLPGGLIYRIQLGAFSNVIPENTFGGLTPVSKEETASNTKYYVGYFNSITEARQALNKIKKYGYPDAFIVSYYEREKISVQRAREIEFAEK